MIWLPRWLDDELHGRGWALLAAGALGVLALALLIWYRLTAPEPLPKVAVAPPAPAPMSTTTAPFALPEPMPGKADPQRVAPQINCSHQHLDLVVGKDNVRGCVAATRTTQNGGLRSYSLEPEGVSRWTLHIGASGRDVVSAALTNAGQAGVVFRCEADQCSGFAIGKPDRHGVRTVTARDAVLQRPDGAAGSNLSVRLTATLAVAPDVYSVLETCSTPSVTIVEASESVINLCPTGGTGASIDDDGSFRYLFQDLEGENLQIVVGQDGSIRKVDFDGWSCTAINCGGISMQIEGDAANPLAGRSFSFSGTTLRAPVPSRQTATVNGSLTMRAQ